MTTTQHTGAGLRPSPDGEETEVPCVGIFWFVMLAGGPEILTSQTPWPAAEDYGDFKTEAMAQDAMSTGRRCTSSA